MTTYRERNKYCEKCGAELVEVTVPMRWWIGHPCFDPETGKRYLYRDVYCPNGGNYLYFLRGHTRYQLDMKGDVIPTY